MRKELEDLYNDVHENFKAEVEFLQLHRDFLKHQIDKLDSEITEMSMRCITKNFDKEFKQCGY